LSTLIALLGYWLACKLGQADFGSLRHITGVSSPAPGGPLSNRVQLQPQLNTPESANQARQNGLSDL